MEAVGYVAARIQYRPRFPNVPTLSRGCSWCKTLFRARNELMVTEHPLGKAALVGCRYLVGSGLAWRGGVCSLGVAPGSAWVGTTRRVRNGFTALSG